MKPQSDPVRLSDPRAAETLELGRAIRELRAHEASAAEIAALASRLDAQFDSPPPASVPGLSFATTLGWVVSTLLVGGVAFFVTLYVGTRQAPSPAAVPPPAARAVARMQSFRPAAVASPAPEPPVAEPATVAPGKLLAKAPARGPKPPAASAGGPEAELSLLRRAQSTLDRGAARALALTAEHAAAYPQGLFVQEREILAIEALIKLTRKAEAVSRAARFLERHPTSPHARRVRPLLESMRAATTQPPSGHP